MTDFNILFEDNDMFVLNKPSGKTVNRSDTTRDEETVQDFVEKHLGLSPYVGKPVAQGEFKSNDEVFKERSGIVHRLDKETSGILLVAKTLSAFESLQKQFKE
ncbi:MAG: pseudouridine synthase, partial [Candidatus Levyibacteriota bacterium]